MFSYSLRIEVYLWGQFIRLRIVWERASNLLRSLLNTAFFIILLKSSTRVILLSHLILFFGNGNIVILRDTKLSHSKIQDLVIAQNKRAIEDRKQILKEIIERNGGEVSIDVAVNLRSKGYLYIAGDIYKELLPYPSGDHKEIRHFEINFNTDPDADAKLEYLIAVSMTYIRPHYSNPNAMGFLFLVNNINDPKKCIIAFNGDQLLTSNELYISGEEHRNYDQIIVSNDGSILTSDFLRWSQSAKYLILSEKTFRDIYMLKMGLSI